MVATPDVRTQEDLTSTVEAGISLIAGSPDALLCTATADRANGRRMLAILMMSIVAALVLVTGTFVFFARVKPPSQTQRRLREWLNASQAGVAPEYHLSISNIALGSGEVYLYQPPGSGIYTAKHILTSDTLSGEPITIADALFVFGAPERVGCLEEKTIPGKLMHWLRLMFAGGQVEASIMLHEDAHRISPETVVHIFFY
jgi:hypothetical protein